MKKSYEIVTPLRNGGKLIESGIVELDAKEGDALVAIGALRAIGNRQRPAPPAPPAGSDKPLEEQSLEELKATAKAEKVPRYGLIKDEAKLRDAIAAHRAKSTS